MKAEEDARVAAEEAAIKSEEAAGVAAQAEVNQMPRKRLV